MEQIYQKIWELAKPYYKKGRIHDIEQVEWMLAQAERIIKTFPVDKKLLFPLIILHDTGYCILENKNPHVKDSEAKKIHMKEGAKIAQTILQQVNYPPQLSKKIVYFVSVHDNWAIGDDTPFQESKVMALFNDLDFSEASSSLTKWQIDAQSMGKKIEEMYDFWLHDEKLTRRPFCCPETKELFVKLMAERKKELTSR